MSSTQELQAALTACNEVAPAHSRWRHKKGGEYQVMGSVIDADDGTARVLYARIGGPEFNGPAEYGIYFVRPVAEWTVDRFVRLP